MRIAKFLRKRFVFVVTLAVVPATTPTAHTPRTNTTVVSLLLLVLWKNAHISVKCRCLLSRPPVAAAPLGRSVPTNISPHLSCLDRCTPLRLSMCSMKLWSRCHNFYFKEFSVFTHLLLLFITFHFNFSGFAFGTRSILS